MDTRDLHFVPTSTTNPPPNSVLIAEENYIPVSTAPDSGVYVELLVPGPQGTPIDVDNDTAFAAGSSATPSSVSSISIPAPELLTVPNEESGSIFRDPSAFHRLSPRSTLSILRAKGDIIPRIDLLTIAKNLAFAAS